MSFDNRDMVRKKGYAIKGRRLFYRGEFNRKPRVSCLAFMGVNGVLDIFICDGTFTRIKFLHYCREFALSGKCNRYPGLHSVLILDGASIHLDSSMTQYLRSLGIHTVM